jgi:hypothetical protein
MGDLLGCESLLATGRSLPPRLNRRLRRCVNVPHRASICRPFSSLPLPLNPLEEHALPKCAPQRYKEAMVSSTARRTHDADRTVDLETAATIRLVPFADGSLDDSPTVERRPGALPLDLPPPELDNVLRLLTPRAPPVYRRVTSVALARADVQSRADLAEPREALLAGWGRTGAAFAREAVIFVRDAVLLFARDATFVLRPVVERFVAASRRGASSLLKGLSQLSRIAVRDWAERSRPRRAHAAVFQARMSDAEIAILHAIADSWGVSPSIVLRTLVLRECQKSDFGVGRPRVPRSVGRDRNRLNRVA